MGLKVSTKKTKMTRINARNQDKIVINEIDGEFTNLGQKCARKEVV